jgi:hypothetical protein
VSDEREPIELRGQLNDIALAEALNARLRRDDCALQWGEVSDVSAEFAAALTNGLELSQVADALNAAGAADSIAESLLKGFEGSAQPGTRPRAQQRRVGTAPARWVAPEADTVEPDSSPEDGPDSSPPARSKPLLEAPPPRALRAMLEDAVVRDLLGPAAGETEEIVGERVFDRYLLGMLAPRRLHDPTAALGPEQDDGLAREAGSNREDGQTDDGTVAATTMFPSAMGLSFCVAKDVGPLRLTVRWGQYRREKSEDVLTEKGNPRTVWRRYPRTHDVVLVALSGGAVDPIELSNDEGAVEVQIRVIVRPIDDTGIVSVFMVNMQDEPEQAKDAAWLFQPELIVRAQDDSPVFLAREAGSLNPDVYAPLSEERALAMVYRKRREFGVGHGVSVHAHVASDDPNRAVRLETQVVPAYEVRQMEAPTAEDEPLLAPLELDMKVLGETDPKQLAQSLAALPTAYAAWIARQRARLSSSPDDGLDTFRPEAEQALGKCDKALERIQRGIKIVSTNPAAGEAFRFANRAMWLQRIHTLFSERRRQGAEKLDLDDVDVPANRSWRAFQLAFLLLNVESVTDLGHPDRSDPSHAVADLLWFPTGGGKTEAYLGLAAYTLGLRRLTKDLGGRDGEHGVSVLMRYTLRLLTLQQFQRATALICACESLRQDAVADGDKRWGTQPFRIGLWVGGRTTPNRTSQSEEALKNVNDAAGQQSSRVAGLGTPVQLKSCPWCGCTIDPSKHMEVSAFSAGSGRTLVYCGDKYGRCLFSRRRARDEGLPVMVVDEEMYRRPPSLLIATVDKFAQMPWNGAVQMLFGQVDSQCERHGFAAADLTDTDHPRKGALPSTKLRDQQALRPPDLIIQDELHLISGPLGTLTGLYETAVDELCSWEVNGKRVRPKVVASTATVRRAQSQLHGLFLRDAQVFPPQGLDVDDNFFARERVEKPGRRYIGICAPGRRLKAAIIRVYVAQLAAAQQLYDAYGEAADPWMTLVGYFSSLRELAGTRRLVDDDIRSRLWKMDRRGLGSRRIQEWSISELTSRLGATEIPTLLERLEVRFSEHNKDEKGRWKKTPLDVLLATNMVSVGVDVKRLGLMVVAGQPKNTAEYIQATSRVGRDKPGLVCTIYNWARPRDLSHYESFEHYHATFYSHVEALSVTPFAPRALDRGLSALLVSLVRLCDGRYAANESASTLEREDPRVQRTIDVIAKRGELVEGQKAVGEMLRKQLERRIDEWLSAAEPKPGGARLAYKPKKDGVTRGLLTQPTAGRWSTFTCLNSLRDVEPSVELVLRDGGLDDDSRPFTGGKR